MITWLSVQSMNTDRAGPVRCTDECHRARGNDLHGTWVSLQAWVAMTITLHFLLLPLYEDKGLFLVPLD